MTSGERQAGVNKTADAGQSFKYWPRKGAKSHKKSGHSGEELGPVFFVSFCASLWLNKGMADFPDLVEASLRARFVSLGVRPVEIEERFVRGSGAGGQKFKEFKAIPTVFRDPRATP